jgi:hypothetical protein
MTTWEWIVRGFKNISAIAVVAGGAWALFNFIRGRTFSSRLQIDIKSNSESFESKRLLFIDVTLTNTGKGKLQARPIEPNDCVYKGEHEEIRYACGLQIRRIEPIDISGETYLDWYNSSSLSPIQDIPGEINLLDDYLVPSDNNKTVFWLEPGDVAQLSAAMVVMPAHYLVKVSFYGIDADEDYWSRLVYARVP